MGTKTRRSLALGFTTLALTGSSALLAAPPAAAAEDPYIPPLGCGVMFIENGPLSSFVHGIEPVLRPVRLEHTLHGVNCGIVLNVEYLLGLQTRPWS